MEKFYRPVSAILWNGNPYQGAVDFVKFVHQLPPTTHEILSIDCQPLMVFGLNRHRSCSILICVHGIVTYSNKALTKTFSQTFVLSPDDDSQGHYFVKSDRYRTL
jgi:NTF2-related export protein 1/2